MRRQHISLKTKLAAALLSRGEIPYDDAKRMTEDQLISCYRFDHNVYHSSKGKQSVVDNVDVYWNLTPMLIMAHRRKTKIDQKAIAKANRISEQYYPWDGAKALGAMGDAIRTGWEQGCKTAYERIMKEERRRKIRSRGFDKTRRRTMRGKVVPR